MQESKSESNETIEQTNCSETSASPIQTSRTDDVTGTDTDTGTDTLYVADINHTTRTVKLSASLSPLTRAVEDCTTTIALLESKLQQQYAIKKHILDLLFAGQTEPLFQYVRALLGSSTLPTDAECKAFRADYRQRTEAGQMAFLREPVAMVFAGCSRLQRTKALHACDRLGLDMVEDLLHIQVEILHRELKTPMMKVVTKHLARIGRTPGQSAKE